MRTAAVTAKSFLWCALSFALPFVPVQQAASQICVPPPQGLVGWWPGDGDADDIAGSNHGTLESGATFSTGMVGQAFSFDGADDFVQVPLSAALHAALAQSVTFDAWVYWSSATPGAVIAVGDSREVQANKFLWLYIEADGRVTWSHRMAGPGASSTRTVTSVASLGSGYHHVAAVRDLGNAVDGVRLYVDGDLVASTGDNGIPFDLGPYVSRPLSIGAVQVGVTPDLYNTTGGPDLFFSGEIDEVELYDRALTSQEIRAIFEAGSAGKCQFEPVAIDIKPGSYPNSMNLSSAGVVPVAILSGGTFDATEVDPATVTLGGASVRLIGKGDKYACSAHDVNDDGSPDLVCHVETVQFLIEPGDSVAVLEAKTVGGQDIRGEDSINIVPD